MISRLYRTAHRRRLPPRCQRVPTSLNPAAFGAVAAELRVVFAALAAGDIDDARPGGRPPTLHATYQSLPAAYRNLPGLNGKLR
jgi:hypothetical protein